MVGARQQWIGPKAMEVIGNLYMWTFRGHKINDLVSKVTCALEDRVQTKLSV